MVKKKKKNPAAVALGRRGGQATARRLTDEQKSAIGRQNVMKRWATKKEAK